MNSRSVIVTIVCVLLLPASISVLRAQGGQCPVGDLDCLGQRFGAACSAPASPETADTCGAWLADLLRHPGLGTAEGQVLLGFTYRALARSSEDVALAEYYRAQAAEIFRDRLDVEPGDALSLAGFLRTSTDPESRVEYAQRTIEADPTNRLAIDVAVLELRKHDPGYSPIRDVLNVQETAYDAVEADDDEARLYVAVGISNSYRELSYLMATSDPPATPSQIAQARAEHIAFLDRLRADLRIDARVEEVRAIPLDDPERTATSLATLCHLNVLSLIGTRYCMDSMDVLVERVAASGGSSHALRVADSVAMTMARTNNSSLALERDFSGVTARFHESMTRWLASSIETASVYTAFARFEPDGEARFAALQRASTLFPADGEVAEMLAWEYMARDRRDEVIAQLLIARDNLPDHTHVRIDRLMRVARGEEDMPAEWSR